jgi:hypothetical protein
MTYELHSWIDESKIYKYHNLDKVDWEELIGNKKAGHSIRANLDKISFYHLSDCPDFIELSKISINWPNIRIK